MLILGMDTSNTVATVAISTEDKVLAEYLIDNKLTHSEKLMPMIEDILDGLNMDISDIDLYAVSKGPGSFTGLRIGVATCKAFAYSLDREIVGVSSLDVLASNVACYNGIVTAIMDARNRRVFACVYKSEGGKLKTVLKEDAYELEDLLESLNKLDGSTIFVGNGVNAYRDKISDILGKRAEFAPPHLNMSRASAVCDLAIKRYREGELDDVMNLNPEYLRESQAERQKRTKDE